MKKILAALACTLAFALDATGVAHAQIADINSAINKAGRERMLSQRVAKAYLQIGQDIDVARSKMVLESSISLFDRQLVELKNYAPTPEIKDTYLKLEKSWLAYKDALVGAVPSQAGARKVVDLSEEVLALAHQGTVLLEKHSGSTAGRLVNLSGRQRMLSQRLAKYYQAMAWDVATAQAAPEIEKARKEFSAGLQELLAAPSNSPALRSELDLVKQQWFFFENAIDQRNAADKKLATNVATTSERILETMDNAVGMYEKLGK